MWKKMICFFCPVLIFLSMGVGDEGTIKSKKYAQRRTIFLDPKILCLYRWLLSKA